MKKNTVENRTNILAGLYCPTEKTGVTYQTTEFLFLEKTNGDMSKTKVTKNEMS